MATHRVVFNSHEEAADAWLGGDSPWVRRIIGITPAPQVGSLYNEGIWDSDAAVWRGKDVVRVYALALWAQCKSVRWVCVSCVLPCSPRSPLCPFRSLLFRNLINVDGKGKTQEPPVIFLAPCP